MRLRNRPAWLKQFCSDSTLWSPWTDISETGDSYVTLRDAEPFFTYQDVLGPSALAYADETDHRHPYVSPVYGDFAKGFPPTLIQGGTKEIFLSNFVRLHQALDQAGQTVKLDLYEGMPHVFMAALPESPESRVAVSKAGDWVSEHLLDD
ncbi:alpha/beta hydrolase fold domain-containing protein [Sulfitobacter sp. JL08]|uniref:alpha/beta hydrolase fold domain-containing protein n=1 Tax=Sulfitobacter sp. JL08 TaxID=2070369 RepID=UPI0013B374C8|nr:alpha/beta hydrolase fold domain-containing protein [Sulfitobacter sp. JL08]